MRILLTGASGYVGTGVLAECFASSRVSKVVSLGRKTLDIKDPKLEQVQLSDFGDLGGVDAAFENTDACFWCLGVPSSGMAEADYAKITCEYTLLAARRLREHNRSASFCFVSGAGADGRAMWARVKKRTEQELAGLDGLNLSIFRPAFIRGDHGAKVRGTMYRIGYALMSPLGPIMRPMGGATSNSEIGRAMIVAAGRPMTGTILDSKEINALAAQLT